MKLDCLDVEEEQTETVHLKQIFCSDLTSHCWKGSLAFTQF